jgi:hypothetical protein
MFVDELWALLWIVLLLNLKTVLTIKVVTVLLDACAYRIYGFGSSAANIYCSLWVNPMTRILDQIIRIKT